MDTRSSNSPNGNAFVNVSKTERVITALAGSLLLYQTIKKHKANSLHCYWGGGFLVVPGRYRALPGLFDAGAAGGGTA